MFDYEKGNYLILKVSKIVVVKTMHNVLSLRTMKDVIPSVTLEQMKMVDKLMVESYHISLRQMMENAGRNIAELVDSLYPEVKNIVCFIGGGGNGAGVLVGARHLVVKGYVVSIHLITGEMNLILESASELKTLRKMGVNVTNVGEDWRKSDLIIDGMVGYNIRGKLKPQLGIFCYQLSICGIPIIANDIPSGVHPDKGYLDKNCIHATQTLTIALPKKGIIGKHLKNVVGELYLGNISVPTSLYLEMGIEVDKELFRNGNVIKIN
jgi:NAD(P)H-hydrate epimerase